MQNPKLIPMFEGEAVRAVEIALTGKAAQPDKAQAYRIGDEVVLLVVGQVKKVTHGENNDGLLIRTHGIAVDEAHVLDEDDSHVPLAQARIRRTRILDDVNGRVPLAILEPGDV